MFGHTNEPVTLIRDVTAIIIPVGESVTLREGTEGFITQALGGSFTVYVEGNLFRISGADADALGFHLSETAGPHFPQLLDVAIPGAFYFLGNVPAEMQQAAKGMGLSAEFSAHIAGFDR